jgi:uncharacterized membrane protein YeaQ/YmgE (transglycosylase-associated protein family)
MSIVLWVFIGVLAGAVANRLTRARSGDTFVNLMLGPGGALFGGLFVFTFDPNVAGELSLRAALAAIVGAAAALLCFRVIQRKFD